VETVTRSRVVWDLEHDFPGWRFRDLGDGRAEARDGDVRVTGTPSAVRSQLAERRNAMSDSRGVRTNTEIMMSIRASVPGTEIDRADGLWVARGPWGEESARCLPDLADKVEVAARGYRERPANLGVL
jgi:hypothetical protein